MKQTKTQQNQPEEDISSMERYERLENNLPERIRPTQYAGSFVYIWTKATRLLKKGADVYSLEDYFNYPDKNCEYEEILIGVMQIANELKGVHPDHYISGLTEKGIEDLLLTFHFKPVTAGFVTNTKGEKVTEVEFAHIMGMWGIRMYFLL